MGASGGGAKNPAAVELGRKGGSVTSKQKATAARENGRKGGRPKEMAPVGVPPRARDMHATPPTAVKQARKRR